MANLAVFLAPGGRKEPLIQPAKGRGRVDSEAPQTGRWAARYSLGVTPAYFLKVRVK